jgi:hypothetical protein
MPTKKFSGTSNKGDFQEALTKAVDKGLNSLPGADMQLKWTLYAATGIKGGIAPKNSVTVTITADVP